MAIAEGNLCVLYIYGFVWKCWVYSQWNSHLVGIVWSAKPLGVVAIFRHTHMAMDQYLYIPFLGGWTSICQLYIYIKRQKKYPNKARWKAYLFPEPGGLGGTSAAFPLFGQATLALPAAVGVRTSPWSRGKSIGLDLNGLLILNLYVYTYAFVFFFMCIL